ncbi:hypothetical protein vseg_012070 [Gypsophila vaccaria]
MADETGLQEVEFKDGVDEVDIEKLAIELDAYNESKNNNDIRYMRTNIRNRTKKMLYVVEMHFWHGSTYHFPTPIPATGGVDYPQFGTPPDGVKFGVVYADGHDSLSRKFVAAAHVPLPVVAGNNPGKVYVEAGPVGPVDWDVIEVKLNTSTSNRAVYDDPIFKGRVEAEIRNNNGYTSISFSN